MNFEKYHSIENHYRQKNISYWLEQFPELTNANYLLTEKIHGANFSWWISPQEIKFAKRSGFVKEDEKFYNYENTMLQYEQEILLLQHYAQLHSIGSLVIYGELCGDGVQKGVSYSENKQFKLFDIKVDDKYLSQFEVVALLNHLGLMHLFVPSLGVVSGLFNALEYDTKFDSRLSDKTDNLCEGIVIKPYNQVYQNENGSMFYIKKKNAEFQEIVGQPNKEKAPLSTEMLQLQNAFTTYINKNRLESLFSKYGEIDEPKQIGEYIKYLMVDAKEDFVKDYEQVSELAKDELKTVYGQGNRMCAQLLKQYL